MHADLRVIERPRVALVHARPGGAAIFGAIEARQQLRSRPRLVGLEIRYGIRLDHGVDHARVRKRDRDADATLRRFREAAAFDLSPRLSGVSRLPKRGTGSAGVEEVGPAHALPARGPHGVGIRRIERDVHDARLVGDEFYELPGRAAVFGLVETTLWI